MAIKGFEVKVVVLKRGLRFRGNLTIDVLVSCNSHFHSFLSYDNNP